MLCGEATNTNFTVATCLNHKLETFVSPIPDHLVYTVNAIGMFLFQKGILVYVNHRWLPEDTKGIIRIGQSKDRQHNGQKKKDKK